LRRQTVVAVPPVRLGISRLRLGLLSLAAVALLGFIPGASAPAFADDPSAGGGGAATAATEVTLRKGDRGRAVRRLQRRLGIAADGVFGPQTDGAVRRFQRRNGLTADGIVGPMTRGKLGLARFSSTDVRHPPKDGPAGGGGSGVKLPRVLREIARCESGGNPRAVSSNGLYRGKFQFSRATWKGVGGRGGDPAKASEAHQDRMALRLYRRQGVAPWPACGS
jgi:peptidoglycan hydrolase-like protein with peptidoglycan-binding domain